MSTTIDIPGGTAELFDPEELTARRTRPLKIIATLHGDLIRRVSEAMTVTLPDGTKTVQPGLSGTDLNITEDEMLILDRYQDATTWALLKSWTLDRPIPDTPDGLQDLPAQLYNALSQATAAAKQDTSIADPSQFDDPEDGDGNTNVPFGSSGTSAPSSPAVKQPSDRKPKAGSKSTGPAKRSGGRTTSS